MAKVQGLKHSQGGLFCQSGTNGDADLGDGACAPKSLTPQGLGPAEMARRPSRLVSLQRETGRGLSCSRQHGPLPHDEVSSWVREVLGLIKEERDRTPGGLQDAARQVAGPAGAREQARAAFGNSTALS